MKKLDDMILEARNSGAVTRTHIAEILALVGKPGKKREQKIEAIKQLSLENSQGYRVEENLDEYEEF